MSYDDNWGAEMRDVGADYPDAEDLHGYIWFLKHRLGPALGLAVAVAITITLALTARTAP